jgi:vacuolar protein sorting-associated protein 8
MQVYDTAPSKIVEKVDFDGFSLANPCLSRTVNGMMSYNESISEIAHSLRVYKGKIFVLVRWFSMSSPSALTFSHVD